MLPREQHEYLPVDAFVDDTSDTSNIWMRSRTVQKEFEFPGIHISSWLSDRCRAV